MKDTETNDIFGPQLFETIDSVNKLIAQIRVEISGDYYNSNHLNGPLDALNEEVLATIKNIVNLRRKLSYLAVKKTNYLVKQLFKLYNDDAHRGKEAVFFLLQLLKDEWEELEIKRLIHAVIENAQSQSQKMRILKDIEDLKLYKRLIRRT